MSQLRQSCISHLSLHSSVSFSFILHSFITITGVVSDVNKDGTYNIVQVETGVIWKNLKSPKDFAAYKSYENGVKAVYRQNEQEYVPITIKAFNPFSAKEGWELLVSALYRYLRLHLLTIGCASSHKFIVCLSLVTS